jgi:hypothetical protein
VINRDLEDVRQQTSTTKLRLARLQGDLNKVRGQYAATQEESQVNLDEGSLRQVKQRLTEEMRRLQPYYRRADDDAVAGIPADSEYVIFIVDTSGSMQNFNWSRVIRKVTETLDVYPQVKGMQIMNDNGNYMFKQYAGQWIPDTPGRRDAIVRTMRNWRPFSDSNPVDGIIYAISTFWSADKKISVYVFGDDFQGGSVETVVREIDFVNRVGADGNRMVRIHAVGFPMFTQTNFQVPPTVGRFAQLMRILCDRNGGTFVALSAEGR